MNISKTEFAVMEVIWETHPCTSIEIVKTLNKHAQWHEKTTKTLINRLLKKGAINYKKEGRQYQYYPVVSQETYQKTESQSFISQLFKGKVSHLVASFADENTLSESDVTELKQIIENWEKNQ